MPPDKPTASPIHTHRGIPWLVIGHIVLGLMWAAVAYSAGSIPASIATFMGVVFSQTTLLGIWGGLGTSPWWKKLIGVVVGSSYLFLLLGVGIDQVDSLTFMGVGMATAFVVLSLLIVRFFRVAIHFGSSAVEPVGQLQFSIRHLMIMTFVVACMISFGKLIHPRNLPGNVAFQLILFTLMCAAVGIIPVWFVLNSKRPILYSIGWMVVAACAGCCYCLALGVYGQQEIIWTTVVATTEAMAVVVSLLVVRSCGYRLLRWPSRSQENTLAGHAVVHSDTGPL